MASGGHSGISQSIVELAQLLVEIATLHYRTLGYMYLGRRSDGSRSSFELARLLSGLVNQCHEFRAAGRGTKFVAHYEAKCSICEKKWKNGKI